MLRKRSWLDEAALVGKQVGSRGEPHGARSEVRKKNEQRRDKGFLIETVS